MLRCFASTLKVMAGCLVSHVPWWKLCSAAVLGPHGTVAVSSAEACLKCVCSHRYFFWGSMGRWCVVVACQQLRRGHGLASAWGQHLQQVVGVLISASCGSGGGQKLRAVGGGSIHKLLCALPGRNVALSPLGDRRSTAGTVVPCTYSTSSGGRCRAGSCAVGPVVAAVCACSKTDRMPHVLPHRWAVGVRFVRPRFACDFLGPTCWVTQGAAGRGHGVCPLVGGPASGLG